MSDTARHHCPRAIEARQPTGSSLTGPLLACALLAWSVGGHAQVDIVPLVTTQFERSSNESPARDETFRSDLLRLTFGFEADYLFGQQQLFLDAAYGTVTYDGLPDFGDDEYAFRGGMQWVIGRYLDGTLEALQLKQVPTFFDSLVEGNTIEEERRLTANVNAQIAQHWRVETAAISRSLDTPIVEIADFGLRETINRVGLRYLTTSKLSFGLEYEDIDGNFRNAPELATYTQRTPAAFLQYAVTDLHNLRLRLGRTERQQADEVQQPSEETTGDFAIERILTGTTSVNVQGSRAIENYFGPDAGAFAVVDRWNAGLNWQVTGKSRIYADYGQTRTEFLGDGVAGQVVTGRIDRASSINVSVESKTFRWLTTELYLQLDDVNSNIDRFTYDGVLVGLKLEARWLEIRADD